MEQLQTYQHSNHRGAKQEDKEQKTENLLKKIMKENFHNLVKQIDKWVQEAQRVPNKLDAKRTKRHHN